MADAEDDETAISEISITADGRIYVFGASYEVLEIIEGVAGGDSDLRRRMGHIRSLERPVAKEATAPAFLGNDMTSDVNRSPDQENS